MRALVAPVLALAGVACAAAVAVAAGAPSEPDAIPVASGPSVPGPGTALTHRQALDGDAAAYAARFGVSLAEARSRLQAQPRLDARLAELERRFPGSFAGGWIQHEPSFGAVARFKGDVPAAARDLGGPGVTLRGGALRSLVELTSLADQVGDDLGARWDTPVVTSYDVETGTVDATLETPAAMRGLSDAQLRSSLPASARGADVHVELSATPV